MATERFHLYIIRCPRLIHYQMTADEGKDTRKCEHLFMDAGTANCQSLWELVLRFLKKMKLDLLKCYYLTL